MSPLVLREVHLMSLRTQHNPTSTTGLRSLASHDDWVKHEAKLIKAVDPSFDCSLLCPVTSVPCHAERLTTPPRSPPLESSPRKLTLRPDIPNSASRPLLPHPNEGTRINASGKGRLLQKATSAIIEAAHPGNLAEKLPHAPNQHSLSSFFPATAKSSAKRRTSLDFQDGLPRYTPPHGHNNEVSSPPSLPRVASTTAFDAFVDSLSHEESTASIQWFDYTPKAEASASVSNTGHKNLATWALPDLPADEVTSCQHQGKLWAAISRGEARGMASSQGQEQLLGTFCASTDDSSELDTREFQGTPCINFSDVEKRCRRLDTVQKAIEGVTLILVPVSELRAGRANQQHEVVFALHEAHVECPSVPGFKSNLRSLRCS